MTKTLPSNYRAWCALFGIAISAACGAASFGVAPGDLENTIYTIAGTGKAFPAARGTTVPALDYTLATPDAIALNRDDNIVVGSSSGLVAIDRDGQATTLIGPGVDEFEVEGRTTKFYPGTATGLAIDDDNNIYFSDSGQSCVYKLHYGTRKVSIIAGGNGDGTATLGLTTPGYSGDGGPAKGAQISYPADLTFDHRGNLYIADNNNHRIRRVDKAGSISTYAGSGPTGPFTKPGFSGDGGPAVDAKLEKPSSIAFDKSGNLYIADSNNFRVRVVDQAGIISTFAGTGPSLLGQFLFGYPGGYSGDGGPARSAQLGAITGLVVDSLGNLFLADSTNHRIRRIDPQGRITAFAGTGTSGYSGDGGKAYEAQLNLPKGLAISSSGTVFICDTNNSVVRAVRRQ